MHVRILLTFVSLLLSPAAGAEVAFAAADGMHIKHQFRIAAPATAGGCYCETWSGGSAQHGVVVMAISGVLSIALTEKDGMTIADVGYRVSGDAAHKLDGLAPIVDQVLGQP